jgi:hypothetical protein
MPRHGCAAGFGHSSLPGVEMPGDVGCVGTDRTVDGHGGRMRVPVCVRVCARAFVQLEAWKHPVLR